MIRIKYKEFRPGSYGKYTNKEKMPYLYLALRTRQIESTSSYMPYLKIIDPDEKHLVSTTSGRRALYSDKYIECTNEGYAIKDAETHKEIEPPIKIRQKNGIDKENRVEKLKEYIEKNNLN